MTENMNMKRLNTSIMLPMLRMAVNTAVTTRFNPGARLIARNGRSTRTIRMIRDTETYGEYEGKQVIQKPHIDQGHSSRITLILFGV